MKRNLLSVLILLTLIVLSLCAHAQIITTIAGDSTAGYNGDNIPAITAELDHPTGVAIDAAGNLYIADRIFSRIRKVSTSGIITTIAGTNTGGYSGDNGPATAAEINNPYGVTVDTIGNIYIGENGGERVRKIDTAGIITTIAGNGIVGYNGDNIQATAAEFNGVGGVAIDKYNNIYVVDFGNDRVRKVSITGIITTVAGTGTCGAIVNNGIATASDICEPNGVAVDAAGNIYIAEDENNIVQKISTSGIITTIAGTGIMGYNGDNISATNAQLNRPLGVAVDDSGYVYISDSYNNRIRKIDASGIITTIAGTGFGGYNGDNGLATAAELGYPVGIAIDHSGNIFIADEGNSRIQCIISTLSVKALNNTASGIKIYPNPSSGLFTICVSSSIQEQVNITIINALGQKVKEAVIFTNTPSTIQLNQPNGIYYLSAVTSHSINNKIINVAK